MTAFTESGEGVDISLIGYRDDQELGGPPSMARGDAYPGEGEAVIDESISDRYGVDIGETIAVVGRPLRVVGISKGGNFIFWQAVFVDYAEAERLLEQDGLATFLLFKLDDPREAAAFAGAVEAQREDLLAATDHEFATATRERVLGELLPIISVVFVLAFIVGLAISGLTIYTATVEKAREWGILKAVGFKNVFLYRVVIAQSLVTGGTGFVAGTGLAALVAPFAADFVPQLVLLTKWQDVLGIGAVTLVMATLAAYIPVRRLALVDPIAVFQA
jgi:putative ABC transport system permease protein